MKTLKEIVLGGYAPKSADEKKFAAKHTVKKTGDIAGNDDKLYKASNIKPVDRETPENHGYNPGTDEKVYEENDALRRKWIKGRAKRQTFKSGQKVKKSIAKDLASKSSEKTVKESAFSDQYKRGDSASRLPERQKPVKAPSIGSRVKSAIKAVDKAVTGLSGKKSVGFDPKGLKTPMTYHNTKNPFKEDTTMTEIPSHIAKAVKYIAEQRKDQAIFEAKLGPGEYPLSHIASDGTGSAVTDHMRVDMKGRYIHTASSGKKISIGTTFPTSVQAGDKVYKHLGDRLKLVNDKG
jgi:hypothetical protein